MASVKICKSYGSWFKMQGGGNFLLLILYFLLENDQNWLKEEREIISVEKEIITEKYIFIQ